MIKVYIFDMDGTLYPKSNGLHDDVLSRIKSWLGAVCGVDESEMEEFYRSLKSRYGDVISAVKAMNLGVEKYHQNVFEPVDVGQYLQTDPTLQLTLTNLPGVKYVVTRSPRFFAERVLTALGVQDQFHRILDDDWFGTSKLSAYELIREVEQVQPNETCVVGDNYEVDLQAACQAGYQCVWISATTCAELTSMSDLSQLVVMEGK